MTNFEAAEVLMRVAVNCAPVEKKDYAEAILRAVWALSMEEVRKDG